MFMESNIIKEATDHPNGYIKNENYIIDELDRYLNSSLEENFEDYSPITSFSLPGPILQPNGMWKIPGTEKDFLTEQLARRAMDRYGDYKTQDDASQLIYGVSYEEYLNGGEENNNE